MATLVFFYVIFDMLVYGTRGRHAPYSIKLLTGMGLSEFLLVKNKLIGLKNVSFFIFMDAAHE
jgi:hypothetical protein